MRRKKLTGLLVCQGEVTPLLQICIELIQESPGTAQ